MSDRRGAVGVLLISLYLVFACFIWVNSLQPQQPKANAGNQILGAQTIALPEASGLPSLNKMFELTNQLRSSQGLATLQINETLNQLAQTRATDMAQRSYYAHQNPEGLYYYDQLKGTAFEATYNCENLALESNMHPQAYLDQWKTSTKGHKECLLNSSTNQVGYGIARLSFDSTTDKDDSFVIVAIQATKPN